IKQIMDAARAVGPLLRMTIQLKLLSKHKPSKCTCSFLISEPTTFTLHSRKMEEDRERETRGREKQRNPRQRMRLQTYANHMQKILDVLYKEGSLKIIELRPTCSRIA